MPSFDRVLFDLMYHQHGGSGLNLTLTDCMSAEVAQLYAWRDMLAEARQEEANAIRSAAGR